MIGESLAHYRILDKLGEGGMGEVYRAEDTKLGREVALKLLPPELASDRERLDRFQREARTLAALDHPNIVHLYSVEEADGIRFLTMQLVPGRRLGEVIPEGGMPLAQLFEIAIPLADALRAAHDSGVTHRDLKPDNVMVDTEGRVRVLDFGLAKLPPREAGPEASQLPTEAMTRVGQVLGTVPYMSPEQVQGKPVDHRTDIFSLGILLYEMAVGRRPFQGENPAAVASSILRDTPAPVTELRKDLPGQFGRIVRRCLEKDPERRLQSAQELRNELEDLQRELVSGAPVTPAAARARPARPLRWLAAALVVLAVIAGAMLWRPGAPTAGPEAPRIASLAVLPLANLSGDPDQDYFADGMTEALITDLSTIGALKVISRTSAMRYRDSELALPEIARALGVDALVEGSVVREADRVRVTARLIEAATDQSLFDERYESELTSVLALQSEVARAIAERIEIALTPEEEARLGRTRSVNPQTYEAYLRGMHQLGKGTSESFKAGIDYLNEAVDNDPADPLAYAGLALGYIRVGHDTGPSELYFPRAVAAANRALELDPDSAMAHAALADAKMYYEWDWPGAGAAFARAVALNPSLAETRAHYAWFHAIFGRWAEAIEQAALAKELDPLSPIFTAWLGGIYWFAGQLEAGLAEAQLALDMAPGSSYCWFQLGGILSSMGRHDEAIAALQKAAELQPAWGWALAVTYGRAGREAEARELLAELEQRPSPDGLGLAMARASLGDLDEAFGWLETAYETRHRWLPWVGTFPAFAPLRSDPRYAELLRRLEIDFEPEGEVPVVVAAIAAAT